MPVGREIDKPFHGRFRIAANFGLFRAKKKAAPKEEPPSHFARYYSEPALLLVVNLHVVCLDAPGIGAFGIDRGGLTILGNGHFGYSKHLVALL